MKYWWQRVLFEGYRLGHDMFFSYLHWPDCRQRCEIRYRRGHTEEISVSLCRTQRSRKIIQRNTHPRFKNKKRDMLLFLTSSNESSGCKERNFNATWIWGRHVFLFYIQHPNHIKICEYERRWHVVTGGEKFFSPWGMNWNNDIVWYRDSVNKAQERANT